MSASSGTTLISPTNTGASARSQGQAHAQTHAPAHHPQQRRQSSHSHAVHSHAHHPKRRASHHHAHHGAHGHHSSHGNSHAGPSRRTSEGEHGRRALVAGLAMQMLDSGSSKNRKRSKSRERPLAKTSRSDTHLPQLSRTTSITSEASAHSSDPSMPRPDKRRSKSGESIQVLSEDGKEAGQVVDTEEEDWESGEDEVKETKPKARSKSMKKDTSASSGAIRRTVSDTQAEVPPKADDAKAVVDNLNLRPVTSGGSGHSDHPHLTQRTTGFAGAVTTPAADAALEAQAMKNVSTPHYNDPTHVMPAHQVRHQQSARSIRMTANASSTNIQDLSAVEGDKTPKPGSMARAGSGQGIKRQTSQLSETLAATRPEGPQPTRSTSGSGLPSKDQVNLSPSFPFPKMQNTDQLVNSPEQLVTSPQAVDSSIPPDKVPERSPALQQPTPPTSADSVEQKIRKSAPPETRGLPDQRQRLASGTEPRLRHRYSNSSLRSIQSLRAPPHPLNSPTGGVRSGIATVATSRPGSVFDSPQKGERRGPSMHQPPIAPPVVYREVAKGEGYSEGNASNDGPASRPSVGTVNQAKDRKSSFSSQRSLQGLIMTNKARPAPGTVNSGVHAQPPAPSKRRTAIEAAAAAARMATTSDPVEYHHSMGYPATSAESAHLISRFLPQRKARHLDWEITSENSEEHSGIGLSRGEYRDAHESLVRMMKDMSVGSSAPARRTASRTLSYQTLLAPGTHGMGMTSATEEGQQVGTTRGRNGTLAVAKGGWQGKSPFEMSVDRCMAQRPQRAV